ncbi:hypothetical protein [Azonexus sp.]|uniref:hypothetical protein n=1 Tax=Azonexus sp. TaxID=1872668 RepID=UPI0039E2C6B1|nr:hypothetical protein [Azonexus sp.]
MDQQQNLYRWGMPMVVIDGGIIPNQFSGIEQHLIDSLNSTNSEMFFAVSKNICSDACQVGKFVELANVAMSVRNDELRSVFPEAEEAEVYATAAFSLQDGLTGISCGVFDTGSCWQNALKAIADEFGGSDAALAALALIGVALAVRLIWARRYQSAWDAATGARMAASIVCLRLLPGSIAISKMAKRGADAKHEGPNGKRNAKERIREIWASGKYSSRTVCAEQECAALDMSFDTARKALRNTPDPA